MTWHSDFSELESQRVSESVRKSASESFSQLDTEMVTIDKQIKQSKNWRLFYNDLSKN